MKRDIVVHALVVLLLVLAVATFLVLAALEPNAARAEGEVLARRTTTPYIAPEPRQWLPFITHNTGVTP